MLLQANLQAPAYLKISWVIFGTKRICDFSHITCPKKVVTNPVVNDTNVTKDGFQKVVNRKRNNKRSSASNKLPKGVPVSKGFQAGKEFSYQPKASNVGSNGNTGTRSETSSKAGPSKNTNDDASLITKGTNTRHQDTGKKKISNIASPNPFAALGVDGDEEEEVENIWDEFKNLNLCDTGASTPAQMVFDVYVCAILESHVDVVAVYDTCKKVNTRADHRTLFCSFVYADNYYIDRRVLWSNLVGHAGLMRNRPWVLGDFNAALNPEDHSAGSYEPNAAMCEFKEIMINLQFNDDFPRSFAIFQPYRISHHSPCVLCIPTGCAMFRVVKRLKGLKSPFCKLLHNHGNLHERVNNIRIELDEAQKVIDRDLSSSILHEEHAHYLLAFKEAQLDEERFLKQKAKIEWLKAGNSNTAYLHKIVKSKCVRNRIEMVSDASNNLYDGNQVPGAFVNHYRQFLGAEGVTILVFLMMPKDDFMVLDVSINEVVKVVILFYRGWIRSPSGPDKFLLLCSLKRMLCSVAVIMDALEEFKQGVVLRCVNPEWFRLPAWLMKDILVTVLFMMGKVLRVRVHKFVRMGAPACCLRDDIAGWRGDRGTVEISKFEEFVGERPAKVVDDLMPTIEEGKVIDEPMIDIMKTRNNGRKVLSRRWWKIWMATEIKTWELLFLKNHSAKLHVWKKEGLMD
ncbi:hypothetical protein Tco_0235863 [Tanacetum coccineum]